jgi:hypothetical protein
MRSASASFSTEKRRFLISDGERTVHLFSFAQKRDGSIYASTPDFDCVRWLGLGASSTADVLKLPKEGKVSFHGSGISHVKSRDLPEAILRRRGLALQNDEERFLGVRHLLSAFPTDRTARPAAEQSERRSDVLLHKSKLLPHVFVFWAIPLLFSLDIDGSVSCDEHALEKQWGVFSLRQHCVLWLSYRYLGMGSWPEECFICCDDGHSIPLIFPGTDGIGRVELRTPEYELNRPRLSIRV